LKPRSDTDDNGILDQAEIQNGTDPLVDDANDTYDDGLPDGDEVNSCGLIRWIQTRMMTALSDGDEAQNGTDPLADGANDDSDTDGLTSVKEIAREADPIDYGTDDDGLPNGAITAALIR
jgi:hypothetical protein